VSYNYGYKIKWLSFYCFISVYTSEYITARTFCSTTTSTFYIYADKILLHAVSIHMITPWHLFDVNLSPPSHIILASNSRPPRLSKVCPIRAHEERTLPTIPHTSLLDFKNRTLQRNRDHTVHTWLRHLIISEDGQPSNLASSTHIEPLRWHVSLSGIQILLQVYYILFFL
jgi:hypothetical protein